MSKQSFIFELQPLNIVENEMSEPTATRKDSLEQMEQKNGAWFVASMRVSDSEGPLPPKGEAHKALLCADAARAACARAAGNDDKH